MSSSDPFPQLSLSLSQGTIDAIMAETGSIVQLTEDPEDVADPNGLQVAPDGFEHHLDENEAAQTNLIPHSFHIETEALQVLSDDLPVLETPTQSVLDAFLTAEKQPSQQGYSQFQAPPLDDPLLNQTESKAARAQVHPPTAPAKLDSDTTIVLDQPVHKQMINPDPPKTYRAVRIRTKSRRMQDLKDELLRDSAKKLPAAAPQSATPKQNIISANQTPAIADFPSNTSYPGHFGFQIFFCKAQESESKKTISYIYSAEESKLYVRMKVHCPVHFSLDRDPPPGSIIRAMVIYSRPQDVGDVVKRCMNHTMEDKEAGRKFPDHLVKCHNPRGVRYEEGGPSNRHSVVFPWETPPTGSSHISGIYEFRCFSSCSGTINRRPTQMIFTLEVEGEILGRQVIELRICACPGRDIVLSEGGMTVPGQHKRKRAQQQPQNHNNNNQHPSQQSTSSSSTTNSQPSSTSTSSPVTGGLFAAVATARTGTGGVKQQKNRMEEKVTTLTSIEPLVPTGSKRHRDNEIYNIQVRGRELYKIVRTIIRNYEISRRYEEIAPVFKQMKELQSLSAAGNGTEQKATTSATIQTNNKLIPEQLSADTSVYDWLTSMELERYANNFMERGMRKMEDLESRLSMEMLEQMQMERGDRERLFGDYVQYKSMRSQSQSSIASSLESYPSFTPPSQGFNRPDGFRIAKTRVVTNYKLQSNPPRS